MLRLPNGGLLLRLGEGDQLKKCRISISHPSELLTCITFHHGRLI